MCSDFFRVKSGSLEKSSYIFNSSVKSGVFQLIEGLGRFKCKYNQEVFDIYEKDKRNLCKALEKIVVKIEVEVGV